FTLPYSAIARDAALTRSGSAQSSIRNPRHGVYSFRGCAVGRQEHGCADDPEHQGGNDGGGLQDVWFGAVAHTVWISPFVMNPCHLRGHPMIRLMLGVRVRSANVPPVRRHPFGF